MPKGQDAAGGTSPFGHRPRAKFRFSSNSPGAFPWDRLLPLPESLSSKSFSVWLLLPILFSAQSSLPGPSCLKNLPFPKMPSSVCCFLHGICLCLQLFCSLIVSLTFYFLSLAIHLLKQIPCLCCSPWYPQNNAWNEVRVHQVCTAWMNGLFIQPNA